MIMPNKPHVDPELIPLIPEFLQRRHKDVDTLRAMIGAGNFADARKLAHKMKGTGTAYGFPDITRLASELEQASIAQDGERATVLVEAIKSCLE